MVAFAFEHVCFALKFIVSYIIPDVPSDVQFKMRKVNFIVPVLLSLSALHCPVPVSLSYVPNIVQSQFYLVIFFAALIIGINPRKHVSVTRFKISGTIPS